ARSHFSLSTICRQLRSSLFPYTTLFRSGFLRRLRGGRPSCRAGRVDQIHRGGGPQREDDHECRRQAVEPSPLPRGLEGQLQHRRSEEHTSELQSRGHLVCRLLLEKKNTT